MKKIFRIFRILLTFQLDRDCFIEYNKNNNLAINHFTSKLKGQNVMSEQSYFTKNDVMKKITNSGIFIGPPKMTSGLGQYSGVIFWYKWTFSPEILEELSERYIDITGIHIMPYRITKDVVVKAANKAKKNAKKFNKEIIPNPEYCDYDPTTGNFHMKPNGKYQVVLVAGGGPGWKGGKSIIESENIENRLKKIKDNYYFPHITSEDNTEESIATLVIDALQALAAVLGPDNVLSQRLQRLEKINQ